MALTYDFKQVVVIFNGFQIQGYAEGAEVSIEYNEDMFTLQVGADGPGTRSKSNNESGRVTLPLMQSSPSNDVLSAFADADRLSNAGTGPLLIKDVSGRSLFTAEQAWIVKKPAANYGNEASAREWILETDVLIASLGGN